MVIKIIQDRRTVKADGTYPVKIRITNNRKQFYVLTPVSVPDGKFLGEQVCGTKYDKIFNDILVLTKQKVFESVMKLQLAGEAITEKRIREMVGEADEKHPVLLCDMIDRHCESLSKERTRGVYRQTEKRLMKYMGKEYMGFEVGQIDKRFLEEYCQTLRKNGISENTLSLDCRNLRTIYNRCIDDNLASAADYPFRKFKIPRAKTPHRSLSIDQLRRLRDAVVPKNLERYRDFFMLSFYLCGMNAIDILFLKPSDISDGHIHVFRTKTGQPISMKIQPEAMEIFDRYKGRNYAINVMDGYTNYLDFVKKLAKNLKKVSDNYGVVCDKVSIYWARHTWATVASYLDISEKTIAAALSHADNSVTGIYINFDNSKVNDANRKVIDFLNSN